MEEQKSEQNNTSETTIALETILSSAVKIPGVKVNRAKFLAEIFDHQKDIDFQQLIDLGPVSAGVERELISKLASSLIYKRTTQSSAASFLMGIPGGLAMAATIPADVAQFFGMALKLAQELSYLYGASDIWNDDQLDDEKVRNQLIMYCGVMFGVSGAVSGIRVLSTQIAKTTLKKLPQKALTKTFWYPIVKRIGTAIGVKVTKTTVAHGISKAVPVIGGVISGTLNFASMMPMANRLNKALDKACFDYSEEELAADIEIIEGADSETKTSEPSKFSQFKEASFSKLQSGWEKASSGAASIISKIKSKKPKEETENALISYDEKIDTLRKLKMLVDEGILTQDEFDAKKKEILDL